MVIQYVQYLHLLNISVVAKNATVVIDASILPQFEIFG
jgi:uncharacterized membrane protein (DUF441 family)